MANPTTAARETKGAAEREMVALSREDSLGLLASHRFGRVAVVTAGGRPVIRPVNYVYDQSTTAVVFRSAPGSKLHALLHSARAALEIDGIDPGLRTGWSVIIQGVTVEVTRAADLARLDRLGMQPWAPGPKPHWILIRAGTISGRKIRLPGTALPGQYLG